MERRLYSALIAFIRTNLAEKSSTNAELSSQKFPDVPKETIGCIVGQEYQRKMKRIHPKFKKPKVSKSLFNRYKELTTTHCDNVIDQLVLESGLCASLIARIILTCHEMEIAECGESVVKSRVSKLMKEPSLIEDEKLSYEVWMASIGDNIYGPITEMIKLELGESHEEIIKQELRLLEIPFVDEHELREEGFDKTPDVKLLVPFMYNGMVINWVESKASFGDDESHKQYLQKQYWSYLNRFGSGLVIYWFGYIKDLDNIWERGLLLSDCFPKCDKITKFCPQLPFPELSPTQTSEIKK